MLNHSHEKEYTPDEEFAIAAAVWEHDRDPKHAAHHLAAALAADPHADDRLALLDEILTDTPDPDVVAPLETGPDARNYFGTVAVHAYAVARLGRTAEAVGIILQVHAARPDVSFLEWTFGWLARDPAAARAVDGGRLRTFLAGVLQRHPGNVVVAPAGRAELELVLRFFQTVVTGPDPDEMLRYAHVALVRKLGRLPEAKSLAEAAYRAHPGYHFATALAMIDQSLGDAAGWEAWCKTALGHDPADVAVRLDLGDGQIERENFDAAVTWYDEVLALEPKHPWATPSGFFARFKRGDGPEWFDQLRTYAAANPRNDRARALVQTGVPYRGFLPAQQEATLGVLRHILDLVRTKPHEVPTGELRMTLSAIESPSARLAVAQQFAAMDLGLGVAYSYSAVQTPDPRRPRGEVQFAAWAYRENDPLPAVPEPPGRVVDEVGLIAATVYDRSRWYDAAAAAVGRLGTIRAEDLIGAMVHPPDLPPDGYAPDWVFRCQVAAALMLANLDGELPWPQSERRPALLDLCRGPMDWTASAAAVALAEVAGREPEAAAEVRDALVELLNFAPRPGYVCHTHPVVCCLQQVPGLGEADLASLREWQAALEAPDDDDDDDDAEAEE